MAEKKSIRVGDVVTGKVNGVNHEIVGKVVNVDDADPVMGIHIAAVTAATTIHRSPTGGVKMLADIVYANAADLTIVWTKPDDAKPESNIERAAARKKAKESVSAASA